MFNGFSAEASTPSNNVTWSFTVERHMNVNAMIVDDVPAARKVTRRFLNRCGIKQVYEASSGSEALSKLETLQVDLVVCDINLGDMNGVELACTLKADVILSDMFLLLMSSDMSIENLDVVKSEGLSYILKPFSLDVLKAKLEQLMEIHL